MTKINVLPEELANKIAAGEVVESCASVVKELVENAIDAKSDDIVVSLVEGGLREIKVVDNGTGMGEEDAKTAFIRHATSKIAKEDDLYFIDTLGFRGEALPSIASVSMVTLKTCEDNVGIEINVNGGKIEKPIKCEARKGTTIIVKDLFYNTPARMKYLKSPKEELALITSFMERLALSKPSIKFSLLNNGKTIIKTSGSDNLLKTIHEIYGYNVSANMIEINNSNDDYDLNGYICKPDVLKSNRNHMLTIVNGRVVKNNELNRAINDAYYTHKPDNKFPIVILNINTDPTLIDVNIHPTKQDIKFSKMLELKELVLKTIKNALATNNLISKVEFKKEEPSLDVKEESIEYYDSKKEMVENKPLVKDTYFEDELKDKEVVQESLLLNEDFIDKEVFEDAKEEIKPIYPVGLLLGTYIACQNEDGIYLIDEHAACERINYEKYLKALATTEVLKTAMLIPITIELPQSEYMIIMDHKDLLTSLGFVFEEFGINTLIFKEHPTWLKEGYEEESIRKILDLVVLQKNNFDPVKFNEKIAITLACRLSIKANDEISMDEMEHIVHELFKCSNPYNCPHGRPTIVSISNYELEKMFKRVV